MTREWILFRRTSKSGNNWHAVRSNGEVTLCGRPLFNRSYGIRSVSTVGQTPQCRDCQWHMKREAKNDRHQQAH